MEQIAEQNKLIAKFMGEEFRNQGSGIIRTSKFLESCYNKGSKYIFLNYQSDWNLLMPVVEKIKQVISADEYQKTKQLRIALSSVDLLKSFSEVVKIIEAIKIGEISKFKTQ